MKKTYRRLKRHINVLRGKDYFFEKDQIYPIERFGSHYGGWDLVMDELNKKSIVYSIGIGEDASFDVDLINKTGMNIYAFDPTPKSIEWVKKKNLPKEFIMHSYGIADFDGHVSFNPPENSNHVSHTLLERPTTCGNAIQVPVKRLSSIIEEMGHKNIDVLKMDIEGAEYMVIDDIKTTNIRPKQLLIEFHHRFENVGIEKTKIAVNAIKEMGYEIFSVSDSGEEICFIYSDT